jgi:hypothetical protein
VVSVCRNWRTIDQVDKEEEEHRDLGGAIDPKKPEEGIYHGIC